MASGLTVATLKAGRLLALNMFQAWGVHGPVLSPVASMLVDVALVVTAFSFMVVAPRTNRMTVAALATLVVSMTAVRVLMQPLPNVSRSRSQRCWWALTSVHDEVPPSLFW